MAENAGVAVMLWVLVVTLCRKVLCPDTRRMSFKQGAPHGF